MALHIVLEEIGVPFEVELVSSRGEREGAMTATEKWRATNPKGRIPALRHVPGRMGGALGLLTEAPAILYYLAVSHPKANLIPRDAAAVARCLEWMNWLSGNVHAMSYGQIWRAQRFSAEENLDAIRAQGRANLAEQHAYIEKLLGDGREWAIPEGYSVVDPYLLVFFHWGQRIGIDMRRSFPAWTRSMERTLARPAVQRVLARESVQIH